ncbi:MAG: hypothetical protein EXR99_07495 [Gemmataceae bacterium]|nr:hypothetical protein [Gemmataceae bacterium]
MQAGKEFPFHAPCPLGALAALAESEKFTCVRRHGRPWPLAAGEEVFLVVDGELLPREIALNGQSLAFQTERTKVRVLVTQLLEERNKLELVFAIPVTEDGAFPDVALEIQGQA